MGTISEKALKYLRANKFAPEVEEKLIAFLKEKSKPNVETNLDKGTLSDDDRELYCREDIKRMIDLKKDPRMFDGLSDEYILYMISMGF